MASHARGARAAVLVLAIVPIAIAGHKIAHLGFSPVDVLPHAQYRLTYDVHLDGHDEDVRVRTFVPTSDDRQAIFDEENESGSFHFALESRGRNRTAVWSAGRAPDGTHLRYTFSFRGTPVRFELAPDLRLPTSYPRSVLDDLRPEPAIQVDAPEIRETLRHIGAHRGSVTERLRRIYAFTESLHTRPFKGMTDALTALRLREASCNGKSRLFVALARAAGIPARLVGGIVVQAGTKRTSHQWVEAWVAGHWVPFCPTNHHFAELPGRYLRLYYGDETLFQHTSDINFEYRFVTTSSLVPSPRAREWMPAINVWALFERLHLSFALLRTVLMLPIGALVVVLFRNVVGVPTFGTFLPALIAAAAGQTGAVWGVAGVLIVVAVVALVRWAFHRLDLLHSPMLAILLAAVTTTMLGTSLVAERLELTRLTYVALFPIAVLAITAERFYLGVVERGLRSGVKELLGTLLVMLGCYVVMNSLALQVLVIGFPEVLLLVIAANVYLGRWVGIRVSEYLRFRHLLFRRAEAA